MGRSIQEPAPDMCHPGSVRWGVRGGRAPQREPLPEDQPGSPPAHTSSSQYLEEHQGVADERLLVLSCGPLVVPPCATTAQSGKDVRHIFKFNVVLNSEKHSTSYLLVMALGFLDIYSFHFFVLSWVGDGISTLLTLQGKANKAPTCKRKEIRLLLSIQ